MRNTQRCGTLALFVAVGLWAQNPPAAIENKLDTPQARVYVATLLPHTPVPSRTGHATNRMVIYIDPGVMTRQEGSDKVQNIEFQTCDGRRRSARRAYVAES